MTRYLTLELVLEYVRSSGATVRDHGLLASALARPQTSLFGEDAYPGLAQKAAALMHSLAQNQSLIDGNKRLALLCGHAFLQINGARIGASHDELRAGDLLAGADWAWAETPREDLRQRVLDVQVWLGDIRWASGDARGSSANGSFRSTTRCASRRRLRPRSTTRIAMA